MQERFRLPPGLAYGLPVFLWIYTYIEHGFFLSIGLNVYREYRLIENLTVVFLLVAVVFLVIGFRQAASRGEKAWLVLLCVGAVYFLGGEISWGYHFMGQPSSDAWGGINDQGEPNLHNLTGVWELLFDRLPRQLLSLGVIVGALLGWRVDRLSEKRPPHLLLRRLAPAGNTFFVAILASLVGVPEKILDHLLAETPLLFQLGNDAGELKECLLALFIAFYAYGLRRNLSAVSSS